MALIKPFQTYQSDDITGLVKSENLAYRFGIEPQKARQVPLKLKEADIGTDMNTYLSQFATKTFETQDDWYWDIETDGDKNIPLAKATLTPEGPQITAEDQAGKNFTEFYLFFEEARFTDVNRIVGEENEIYPIGILDEPKAAGDLWMYKCNLQTGNENLSIPYEELMPGKRFSKDFSPVEHTLSEKGGGINHDFPYRMYNSMTMMRMEDLVPGDMIKRPTKFHWKNSKTGKTMTSWMDKRTYDFEMQFLKEINYLMMYSTSNMAPDGSYKQKGKSGHYLKLGSGLKEQMSRSNYYTFNKFNIEKLTDMLLELSVGKINKGQREVNLSTGEWGMVDFHKDLERLSTLYTPARDNHRIYGKGGNSMGYRGQFMEFYGPQGVKVNIMHDPTKDDSIRNKKYHPSKPGLIESRNMDLLNMGTSDGSSNIEKITVKDFGEIRKWREGLRSPYNYGEGKMEIKTDAWEETRAFIGGVQVYDPGRTGRYELNI